VGQQVKVASGPFAGQIATVESIDHEKGSIAVLVEMFGRKTQLDLKFEQIEVI
jgi:transcriptional antiterminator NusG